MHSLPGLRQPTDRLASVVNPQHTQHAARSPSARVRTARRCCDASVPAPSHLQWPAPGFVVECRPCRAQRAPRRRRQHPVCGDQPGPGQPHVGGAPARGAGLLQQRKEDEAAGLPGAQGKEGDLCGEREGGRGGRVSRASCATRQCSWNVRRPLPGIDRHASLDCVPCQPPPTHQQQRPARAPPPTSSMASQRDRKKKRRSSMPEAANTKPTAARPLIDTAASSPPAAPFLAVGVPDSRPPVCVCPAHSPPAITVPVAMSLHGAQANGSAGHTAAGDGHGPRPARVARARARARATHIRDSRASDSRCCCKSDRSGLGCGTAACASDSRSTHPALTTGPQRTNQLDPQQACAA